MAKKAKKAPEGAPLWCLTYGDMMSLLLCFFIMLAALANFDDRDKMFMIAMESIRRAFGNPGQAGWMPDNTIDFKSFLVRFETLVVPDKAKNFGLSQEPGAEGEYYRVRKIRDGAELVIGGPIAFGRFSAEIEPAMDAVLQQLVEEIRGKRNKIEIRGHTTREPLPEGCGFRDQIELGYARARNVRDRLVELGADPRALRVVSVGPYEPLLKETYTDGRRAADRRVEIVVTQALLSDYEPPPAQTGAAREWIPPVARPRPERAEATAAPDPPERAAHADWSDDQP